MPWWSLSSTRRRASAACVTHAAMESEVTDQLCGRASARRSGSDGRRTTTPPSSARRVRARSSVRTAVRAGRQVGQEQPVLVHGENGHPVRGATAAARTARPALSRHRPTLRRPAPPGDDGDGPASARQAHTSRRRSPRPRLPPTLTTASITAARLAGSPRRRDRAGSARRLARRHAAAAAGRAAPSSPQRPPAGSTSRPSRRGDLGRQEGAGAGTGPRRPRRARPTATGPGGDPRRSTCSCRSRR